MNSINSSNPINPINPTNSVVVSVIVTTRNEERNIASCLESVKNSINSINPFVEIIVVDNNSTDNTVKIAREFTDKVYNKGPERSAQRNYGTKKAEGKYILYLDADMILSEGVIEECMNKCESEDYVALYIPERIIGSGFWVKVRDFERSFYNVTYIDAVRFINRDKSLEMGGFDENLTGPEDWDFDRRIRNYGNTGIIHDHLCHNERGFNLKEHIAKKTYYSRSFERYKNKWGRNDKIAGKQLEFWYRYIGLFIEKGKWKRLFTHPILSFSMYFLRFLVGVNYLAGRLSALKEDQ